MKTIIGPGFTVSTPDDWNDITNEVEAANPPFTLTAREGFGALQFSIALYRGGRVPNPSLQDLLNMIIEFGKSHHLGRMKDMVIEDEKILLASVTFRKKTDIVRVWQISDGKNFAFVTYTCDSGYPNDEIEKCEVILRVVVKFGWF